LSPSCINTRLFIPNLSLFSISILIGLPSFIIFGSWAFNYPWVPYPAGPSGMPMSAGANCHGIFLTIDKGGRGDASSILMVALGDRFMQVRTQGNNCPVKILLLFVPRSNHAGQLRT
jgi:hypothetical protein